MAPPLRMTLDQAAHDELERRYQTTRDATTRTRYQMILLVTRHHTAPPGRGELEGGEADQQVTAGHAAGRRATCWSPPTSGHHIRGMSLPSTTQGATGLGRYRW
jgi:hypothetical protein